MKKKITFINILQILLFSKIVNAQFPCPLPDSIYWTNVPGAGMNFSNVEIRIFNQTNYFFTYHGGDELSDTIKIKIYPVGFFYNGDFKYSPKSITPIQPDSNVAGIELIIPPQTSSTFPSYRSGNWDASNGNAIESQFSFGYGKYRIEFYRRGQDTISGIFHWIFSDFVYLDYRDSDPHVNLPINPYSNIPDIRLDYFSKDTITFQHSPHYNIDHNHRYKFWHIDNVNKDIKMWNLFGTCAPALTPSKEVCYSDSTLDIPYLKLPINANRYNGNLGHENPGDLGMNLVINHNITTRDTALGNGSIMIAKNGYLKIAGNKTFNMTPPLAGYHNLIVQDSSLLWLDANAKLIVSSGNRLTLKSKGTIKLGYNSEIIFKQGSIFCNEGGKINSHEVSATGWGRIVFDSGYHQINCSQILDFAFKDSSKLVLEEYSTLEIPDSVTLQFTGSQTGLIMKPNSKLKMGLGSKILFDNSAVLIANGAEFSSSDTSEKWEGIILSNSGIDSIIGCTFSNAKTALSIINDSTHASTNRIIKDNTFNIPWGGEYRGIYGENNYRLLIQNNTFNMPVYYPGAPPISLLYVGLYLKNNTTGGAAGETPESEQSPYSLNIVGNTFSNGCASVILANYLSNVLPYNVSRNVFNSTASANLIGIQINGVIKNNQFTSNTVPLGIHLINSSPDFYNNTIESKDVALHLAGQCLPNLAPYISGSDMIWTGGNNTLNTQDFDNIQLSSAGNVFTDWGNNNFNTGDSAAYHIYGWMDSTVTAYYSRDNCWNSTDDALISLTKNNSSYIVPPVFYNGGYDCITPASATGWIIVYKGNGNYDSTKKSSDVTGGEPSELDILYSQALTYEGAGNYPEAIATFKSLADEEEGYSYHGYCFGGMYSCYDALDTNANQSYRNELFTDLIEYLEDKILSELCGDVDGAYAIIAECESKLGEYNQAAGGYEMLALYHPDPNVRLAASWNYEEIQGLINMGSGQSMSNYKLQISNEEFYKIDEQLYSLNSLTIQKEIKRLNKIIREDPVMSKIKKSFDKATKEKDDKAEKQLSERSGEGKEIKDQLIKVKELERKKEDRARRNIFESRLLSKEVKEQRRLEDLAMTTMDVRNQINRFSNANVPMQYSLGQNYPNPFNPTTTIFYSIPISGMVRLKIYDITGREIVQLVNEIKETGRYEIRFDGSNLPSGVYFYKLESNGKFIDTKRMILIK